MSHSRLEKRIEALERKLIPDDVQNQIQDAFLEILTDNELRILEQAIKQKEAGTTEVEAQAWLDGIAPEISFKFDLATDAVLHGERLDEYNQVKQAVQDSLYKPKAGFK